MAKAMLTLVLLCMMTGPSMAQEPTVMLKELTDVPSKEALMIMVEYPPGGSDPVHRHNAQTFLYVLDGSGSDDVHIVGRNASATKPAKFLVLLVKKKGAPVLVPAK